MTCINGYVLCVKDNGLPRRMSSRGVSMLGQPQTKGELHDASASLLR